MVSLTVNGKTHSVDADPSTPLLWVLRDTLGMTGTKFGCGMALCGACTVHVDGKPVRSCITPVSAVAGQKITTIEAVGATAVGQKVQAAWAALDVPQCGYCQSGQIMGACALLAEKPDPTDARHRRRHGRQHLPLRDLPPHPRRHPQGRRRQGRVIMAPSTTPSRREFLKAGAAAAGGGLVLGVVLPDALTPAARAAGPAAMPNAWVKIGSDNSITILSARSEMGQGVYTAMPTLVAEELEVDLAEDQGRDRAAAASPTSTPCSGARSPAARPRWPRASTSSASPAPRPAPCSSRPRRRSGAWTPPAAARRTASVLGPAGQKATYGELAEAASQLPVPKDVKLKEHKELPKYVGKPVNRLDTPAKINGTAEFGIDVKLPGMLYAVARAVPGHRRQGR